MSKYKNCKKVWVIYNPLTRQYFICMVKNGTSKYGTIKEAQQFYEEGDALVVIGGEIGFNGAEFLEVRTVYVPDGDYVPK